MALFNKRVYIYIYNLWQLGNDIMCFNKKIYINFEI